MGGSVGSTIGRAGLAGITGGLSEFAQKNPFGAPIKNPAALPINNDYLTSGSLFGGQSNPYVSGPFSLDPSQLAADQSNINTLGTSQAGATNQLGQEQFDQTTKGIPDLVAKELTLENPQIQESLNASHLLDSSAYPTEIARQQALLTSQLAVPAMQQLQSTQQAALQGKQGFQSGALQRGLSLEDQINNANISKSIGQIFAPQPPSGKSQFGTAASGVGALSPWFAKGGALGKAPPVP